MPAVSKVTSKSPTKLDVGEVDFALPSDRGAEEAWADLYRRHFDSLCDTAARLIGPSDAADAVQDAMMHLWRQRKHLPPEARTARYVKRSVHNYIIDRLRQRRDDFEEVELSPELEATLAAELPDEAGSFLSNMTDRLDAVVDAMPPRCREAYVLIHERGLSGPEAATEMKVALPTLRTHVARMNAILRASLKRAALELEAGAAERLLPAPPDALPTTSAQPLLPGGAHD